MDHSQMASEYLYNLSGQLVPVFSHPHRKCFFFHLNVVSWFFQLCQISSCPVTVHHWKELGSIFSPPPFPVRSLKIFGKVPWAFFSQLCTVSAPSASPYMTGVPSLDHPCSSQICNLISAQAKLDQRFIFLKCSRVFLQPSKEYDLTLLSVTPLLGTNQGSSQWSVLYQRPVILCCVSSSSFRMRLD